MGIDERTRRVMYERLEDVLGLEAATTLMEHLPPIGWADVATKRDVDALAAATKRDIEALAAATKRDVDALAAATKRDIEALGLQLRTEMDAGFNGLRAEFHREQNVQTRTIIFSMFAAMATMTGVGAGLAQIV